MLQKYIPAYRIPCSTLHKTDEHQLSTIRATGYSFIPYEKQEHKNC